HGIPEYWIVNVAGDQVETHREPKGEQYTKLAFARRHDVLEPVLLPGVRLSVATIVGATA
ncbi:MAG TPA: Uma2 family endonuclease, partial [Acetobacteraceae bacterium]|nr:Uma2 family endonuclease [Acetobacteraceae bacterium]